MKQDFDPERRQRIATANPNLRSPVNSGQYVSERPRQDDDYGVFRPRNEMPTRMSPRFVPPIDVVETTEGMTVVIDLPGTDAEDVELQVTERRLRVLAERDDDFGDDGWIVENERPITFERTMDLPTAVEVESVDATYDDGVCRIFLPKGQEGLGRTINFD